jgi:hypothetical protein
MELLLVWTGVLTILLIVGIVWILDLQRRLRWLQSRREGIFAGEEGDASLAAALENLAARLSETNARTERLVAQTKQIDDTLAHVVQGVGLVRFRAFQDTGGDQSFALALARETASSSRRSTAAARRASTPSRSRDGSRPSR